MAGFVASYDLERFLDAQEPVFETVLAELAAGRKRTHWMWFMFPQIAGLGASAMAERYGIATLEEARAYLRHPVLGERLRRCTGLVREAHAASGKDLTAILGYPDDLKFRSCVTLFGQASDPENALDEVFDEALTVFFDGAPDVATLERL